MVLNSSVMTCLMPEVGLPSDFVVADSAAVRAGGGATSLSGGPHYLDLVDVYVGLVFDGFTDYNNLTAARPDTTIEFYQPPTIHTSTDLIVYRPRSGGDIHISVRLYTIHHRALQ